MSGMALGAQPSHLDAISAHLSREVFRAVAEMRALRALKREAKSPFIFVSERGAPFTVSGLQKLIERAGIKAQIGFKVHPHMLRHACGYALANQGTDTRTLQAYLGHRSIQSTVRYTELAPGRFKNIWR
jgi:site-specific recombinase XerD